MPSFGTKKPQKISFLKKFLLKKLHSKSPPYWNKQRYINRFFCYLKKYRIIPSWSLILFDHAMEITPSYQSLITPNYHTEILPRYQTVFTGSRYWITWYRRFFFDEWIGRSLWWLDHYAYNRGDLVTTACLPEMKKKNIIYHYTMMNQKVSMWVKSTTKLVMLIFWLGNI